jgi:pectinesterase
MTHLRGKRLPGRRRALAAVTALVASFVVGSFTPAETAETVTAAESAAAGQPFATPRWSDEPHGFASLAGGTTGGAGGRVVTVTDQASLMRYASAEEPYVIRVKGSIAVEPFGSDIADFYKYVLHPAAAVPALVTRFSGPQRGLGRNTVLKEESRSLTSPPA